MLEVTRRTFFAFTVTLAGAMQAQNATGPALARSSCGAAAVTGSNNRITIKCEGVGGEQGRRIVDALNALLADRSTIDAKLDRILLELVPKPPRVTIMNSLELPAGKPFFSGPWEETESKVVNNPGLVVRIQIEGDFVAPMFRVICSQACVPIDAIGGAGGMISIPPRYRIPFPGQENVVDVIVQPEMRSGDMALIALRSWTSQPLQVTGVAAILPSVP